MDNEGREVYCPMCLKYRAGDGSNEVVSVAGCLTLTRKLIGWHRATYTSIGGGAAGGQA